MGKVMPAAIGRSELSREFLGRIQTSAAARDEELNVVDISQLESCLPSGRPGNEQWQVQEQHIATSAQVSRMKST